jgi:type IV pilus biogenesis/stability protein PilW
MRKSFLILLFVPGLLLASACAHTSKANRAAAHVELGRAYLIEHDTEGAITELRRAVELNPKNWEAWDHLGVAYMEKNRPTEATQAFKRALRLDRARAEPNLNYGLLLFSLGKTDEAIAHYRVALDDLGYRKTAFVLNNLGFALYSEKRYDEAAGYLNDAVKRAPNLCAARYNLGLVERAQGSTDKALETFEQGLLVCPDDLGTRFQAGSLLISLGDLDRGPAYLYEIIEKAPESELAQSSRSLLEKSGL